MTRYPLPELVKRRLASNLKMAEGRQACSQHAGFTSTCEQFLLASGNVLSCEPFRGLRGEENAETGVA